MFDGFSSFLGKQKSRWSELHREGMHVCVCVVWQSFVSDFGSLSHNIKALMTADLPLQLISLLEELILQQPHDSKIEKSNEFSKNKNLQNLLILTAIKADTVCICMYVYVCVCMYVVCVCGVYFDILLSTKPKKTKNKTKSHESWVIYNSFINTIQCKSLKLPLVLTFPMNPLKFIKPTICIKKRCDLALVSCVFFMQMFISLLFSLSSLFVSKKIDYGSAWACPWFSTCTRVCWNRQWKCCLEHSCKIFGVSFSQPTTFWLTHSLSHSHSHSQLTKEKKYSKALQSYLRAGVRFLSSLLFSSLIHRYCRMLPISCLSSPSSLLRSLLSPRNLPKKTPRNWNWLISLSLIWLWLVHKQKIKITKWLTGSYLLCLLLSSFVFLSLVPVVCCTRMESWISTMVCVMFSYLISRLFLFFISRVARLFRCTKFSFDWGVWERKKEREESQCS